MLKVLGLFLYDFSLFTLITGKCLFSTQNNFVMIKGVVLTLASFLRETHGEMLLFFESTISPEMQKNSELYTRQVDIEAFLSDQQ